ncbi:Membrane transport protein [Marinomonas spartinae]|uniref:Membrane transport protein n=1 Tax=Marinomonas spartinae TaxID=1792290 RepID=A0A1A8T817_9GAMM|nr:AEC family transporter [Marinomonas spartinae]SBS28467.1 Membrane transport protein [Marinomonas spartinae]
MESISLITIKICLLVSISIIGLVIGKRTSVNAKDISLLLVYVISPFVIFYSIINSPSDLSFLKYSLGSFLTSSFLAILAYKVSAFLWSNNKRNLFSFSGGTGNTGYFALPIVLSLFSPEQWGIAIFIIIGVNIYEFSVGYFITAKGNFSTKECILKLFTLPILYAAFLGLIFKYLEVHISSSVLDFMSNFKGAYSVLGMMVIGISLSKITRAEFDVKYLISSVIWKHLIVPFLGVLFYYQFSLDKNVIMIIALMLSTPMAGNVVVVSNQLNVHSEIAAIAVMISTLLSVFSIPICLYIVERFF